LKYWDGSRVEAEGADGKERMRRIPFSGLQRMSDVASAKTRQQRGPLQYFNSLL